ncbi:hypothetical protein RCG17_22960 [Neobacillus sp. PS3-12]|uniref:hypothetical protein n=1 Tax=Neobacillus sp. PS3-12 TaxID=3070677 RepID=UPI0027E1AA9F|nr:hypothetical protein [Neobacillus sp. PS3-12]WML52219.1 hypothetical protein RCG17_22960 [Neobacillus sp. PS3-12]
MFETIGWRFYINAKTKDNAQNVLTRIEKVTGNLKISSLEQYWKDNSLFEVYCDSSFQVEEPEKAIFEVLLLVNQLGHDIDIVGPLLYENEQVEFSGNCSRPSIVGLKWLHFYLDNFR